VQSSIDNAKLNGVEDRLTAHLGDGRDPGTPGANGQADVVVANILIDPVLELEPLFAGYCKVGGEVALSGILHGEQSASVVAKYARHFDDIRVDEEDGWACVHGVRNGTPV
jgi:ribosomal protein L11 methyltransferase